MCMKLLLRNFKSGPCPQRSTPLKYLYFSGYFYCVVFKTCIDCYTSLTNCILTYSGLTLNCVIPPSFI